MIQKPITTSLTISHIEYSPSRDVIMMYCKITDSEGFITYPEFKSGQFMLLAAEIDDKIIKRSYSIATSPQLLQEQGLIGFSIKRVEGGVFSTRATQVAQSGDSFTMTGPLGKMIDHQDCDNYLLISAGSGLSPIYSIYRSLLHSSRSVRIANIFGERYFSHVLPQVHQDWVENVGSTGLLDSDAIYSQCFLSQDSHDGYMIGRVQQGIDSALIWLNTKDIRVFLCGSHAMVDDVRDLLIHTHGIDSSYIHFEKY